MLFGLFPALQASRGNLHGSLKEGTRGNSARRSLLRSALVVVQVALALVSLVGALLFVRTFQNLDSATTSASTRAPLMTMRFYMPGEAYERAGRQAAPRRGHRPPHRGAAGRAGGVRVELRAAQRRRRRRASVDHRRPAGPSRTSEPCISLIGVTPHFHRDAGRDAIVDGRDFTDAEGWSRSRFAIINETMAHALLAERAIRSARASGWRTTARQNDWFTVIGVAPDIKHVRHRSGGPDAAAAAYVPYAYQQTLNTGLTIRVAGEPASDHRRRPRREIRASDPNLPIFQVRTMEEVRRLGFWQYGLFGWIFGDDRRRRTAARLGRRLRRAVVLGLAAHRGDRRPRGARRRDAATCCG